MIEAEETFDNWEFLAEYSRQEAFENGFLIDLSSMGREVGLRYPLAITPEVYYECVMTADDAELGDERERALDLATQVAGLARASIAEPVICFDFVTDSDSLEVVALKLVCSNGDFGEPVLTVLHNA
jgi:hypothetical protein